MTEYLISFNCWEPFDGSIEMDEGFTEDQAVAEIARQFPEAEDITITSIEEI